MYWGCGTAGNRTQWALFAVLSLVWAILWIVSRAERTSCQLCSLSTEDASECRALSSEDWNSFDEATQRVEGCSIRKVAGTFYGGLVAVMMALIPLCVMACTRKPEQSQLASHSDLLRQSLQFYVGQPSDITDHAVRSASQQPSTTSSNGARYSALYNAMYN